jgi:hypothetical protein
VSYFLVNDYPDEDLVVYGPFPTWEAAAKYVEDYWASPIFLRIARLDDPEPWWDNDDIQQSPELEAFVAVAKPSKAVAGRFTTRTPPGERGGSPSGARGEYRS